MINKSSTDSSKHQSREKRYYVYFHKDLQGNIFYVGKGTRRRAWSKYRHEIWKIYVQNHLQGQYIVEIYKDQLTERKAEELENELIEKYGKQLVNWINMGQEYDLDAIERRNQLMNDNEILIEEARSIEKINPDHAIEIYRIALKNLRKYMSICCHKNSLLEQLQAEMPKTGGWIILDRLTLCLVRMKRYDEAIMEAEKYFNDFPGVLNIKAGEQIRKRIEKAKDYQTKY